MNDVAELTASIEEVVTQEEYSPYKLSKCASQLAGKYVREQMLYNYCSKGMIPSYKDSEGRIKVSREAAIEWLNKYLTKNG